MRFNLWLPVVSLVSAVHALAEPLKRVEVAENIYAIVGPLEQRSPENLGNNATFGFVVTAEGVVLIDSGGTLQGAQALEQQVREVTELPINWVINTGGQDHRWFGNQYFTSQGAQTIAASATVQDQITRESQQVDRMRSNVQGAWEGTLPEPAREQLEASTHYEFGGVSFSVIPLGPTHTPNESLVWLEQGEVLFSGDSVYVERMLNMGEQSQHRLWIEAFATIEALNSKVLVPGHGHPTTLQVALRDTRDYLVYLREQVAELLDAGSDIQSVNTIDQSRYSYLAAYEELHGRNAQRIYEEMEWE